MSRVEEGIDLRTIGSAPLGPGGRCRSTRTIVHRGGVLGRAAEGTVISIRENVGRVLFAVGFDTGERLILFSHELEAVTA